MTKPITRRCLDCGDRLKNRSKGTKRCHACKVAFIKFTAHGRTAGNCVICGAKLSAKRNATSACAKCFRPLSEKHGFAPGHSPWNSGKSLFSSPEHYRIHKNERRKKLRATMPPQEFISDRIRTLIRNSLKRVGERKNTKTAILLGCSTAEFKAHLERQFIDGMGWHNYGNGKGKWNIDHIRQLCEFDLREHKQRLIAFHFSNCRPLWSVENFARPRIDAAATLTACITF